VLLWVICRNGAYYTVSTLGIFSRMTRSCRRLPRLRDELMTPEKYSSGHAREGIALSLLAAALWGLTPVATKIALDGFSPESLGVLRLAFSAILFRVLSGKQGRWFSRDIWIWVAAAGLAVDFLLYNYGVQRTAANTAGLVVNVELVSTIILAVWFLQERLTLRRILGSAVTLSGVLIVTFDGLKFSDLAVDGRTVGNGLVMAAAVSWSLFAVAQRRTTFGRNLFERLTPIFSISAIMTAPSLLQRQAWVVRAGFWPIVMFIILTVFGTALVYWIYARAQQLVDVTILAVFLCTIPVFTVLFSYGLLREPLTAHLLIGGAIIVVGMVIATEHMSEADRRYHPAEKSGTKPR
jgi:drug/metabolite transporter (DMT)-like permease